VRLQRRGDAIATVGDGLADIVMCDVVDYERLIVDLADACLRRAAAKAELQTLDACKRANPGDKDAPDSRLCPAGLHLRLVIFISAEGLANLLGRPLARSFKGFQQARPHAIEGPRIRVDETALGVTMGTISLNTLFDHLRRERNCHLAAFGETWFSLHLCERGIEGGETGQGCPIIGQIGVEVSETAIVAVIRRRFRSLLYMRLHSPKNR
jgi:hypothetical protein